MKTFKEILNEELSRPHRGNDFIEDLAYILHFGDQFEIWERNHIGVSSDKKIRQLLAMWKSAKGDEAIPSAMVQALKQMKGT